MIMKEYLFDIAGFVFEVIVSDNIDIEKLLPLFGPFWYDSFDKVKPFFRFYVNCGGVMDTFDERYVFVDESVNDMGRVRLYSSDDKYCIKISFMDDDMEHIAFADKCFHKIYASVNMADKYAGEVISSLLRMIFSQAIIPYGGISVHASSVLLDGKSYLFMGKSGTGKSTHSALWIKAFDGCSLINDDNPVIFIKNGVIMASGTPWSGKTPCYRNVVVPVGGIVRLRQAMVNRFTVCNGFESFVNILPGCSVIKKDAGLQNEMHDTLASVCESVNIGVMECLPDIEAAFICRQELEKSNIRINE